MKRWRLVCLLLGMCMALGACSAGQPAGAQPKPCADVVAAIRQGQAFEEMTALADTQILKFLDLNAELLTDMAMEMDASRATAEMIVVLTARDKDALGQAQEALSFYRHLTLEQYRDYRPEETPKLEDAVLKTNGLQTVLIVSKDAPAADRALTAAWK